MTSTDQHRLSAIVLAQDLDNNWNRSNAPAIRPNSPSTSKTPMNISDDTSLLKSSWWDGFAIGTLVGAGGLILICVAIVAAMGRL